jgi:prolyl-tRNA editing enzyme YbaK/EbsC (Cys-tRNA(Pro) deacylase)
VREKVKDAARELGLDINVTTLDESTRTVAQAARAVGCHPAQIAKSIVFVADGEPVMAVVSGNHRVDVDKLCNLHDCADARQASADEVRAATGYAVGGVPPFGHELPVIFDEWLMRYDRVWAAGGDGNTLFEITPERLAECTRAKIGPLGE